MSKFNIIVRSEHNQVLGCAHHFCGNSWVTVQSTATSPGGIRAWGICCKCGAQTAPAESYVAYV